MKGACRIPFHGRSGWYRRVMSPREVEMKNEAIAKDVLQAFFDAEPTPSMAALGGALARYLVAIPGYQ